MTELDLLDDSVARIIHYYELVTDDPIDNLLLLGRINRVDVACPMKLSLAPIITFTPVKHFIDVDCLVATLILVETLVPRFDFRGFWVVATVSHLCHRVILLTPIAPDQV